MWGLKDAHRVAGGHRGQGPVEQFDRLAVTERGGVQQAAHRGVALLGPEGAILHPVCRVAGQRAGPGHRDLRVLAAPDRGPAGRRPEAGGEALRVEYCDRAATGGAGGHGDREVIRAGRRGDHRSGRVEDHRDHHMQALTGAWRAEQHHRVLHRSPAGHAARRAQRVADLLRGGTGQRRAQRGGLAQQRLLCGRDDHLTAARETGQPGRVVLLPHGKHPPGPRAEQRHTGDGRHEDGQHAPVDGRRSDRSAPSGGGVARAGERGHRASGVAVRHGVPAHPRRRDAGGPQQSEQAAGREHRGDEHVLPVHRCTVLLGHVRVPFPSEPAVAEPPQRCERRPGAAVTSASVSPGV